MRYGRARDAFTLIEMLLVIGIMGAVSGLTIPLYRQYAIRNDLSIARGAITQGVDRARALANAGKEGSAWGFSMEHGVLFKGSSYDERDPAFDESYPIPKSISQTGTTEVWFSQGTGTPNAPGAVITLVANDGQDRVVTLELNGIGTPVSLTDTILLCHQPGPTQTQMYVSDAQLPGYLAQGDIQGVCPASSSSSSSTSSAASSSSESGGGGSGGAPALTTDGLFVLASTGQGALAVSDDATLTVASGGAATVNSSHSAAVTASGDGRITTPVLSIVGSPGTFVTGNAQINGTVQSGVPPAADPLASLVVPTIGATELSAVSVAGNASVTIGPNTYKGLSVSGNGRLILNPGFYYLTGNLSVTGNGRLTGSGVTLYNANSTMTVNGNGALTLSPPSSGAYAGVAIFQNRTLGNTVSLTGNGSLNITGAVYAANALLSIVGDDMDGVIGSPVVVKNLTVTGDGTFEVK